ncbi:MAG: cache domain-containing protein [Sedimentisphaerales bacterium]|nr:cache domain-containing protein [Sedimentisphaerales bacterium]
MATHDRTYLAVSIKTRILLAFLMVILVLAVPIAVLGYRVIEKDIIESAERKVLNDLTVAEMVYTSEIERIGQALRLASPGEDAGALRDRLNLHYLRRVERARFDELASEVARAAVTEARPVGGTRVISPQELAAMQGDIPGKVPIEIKATPKARPTDRHVVSSGMAKEYAVPVFDKTGEIKAVLYGGRVINRDYTLVDRVRDMVFGKGTYKSKPVGTVTIFQDDVRISTNVQNEAGQRAIGTRVSDEVYEAVIRQGRTWHERAFVVTDWYKTAYEPIRNIRGDIIGVLYVGILEQPFNDMARQIFLWFLLVVVGVTVIAVLLSFILAGAVSRPLTQVVHASECLASGDWGYQIAADTTIKEINSMAEAFNAMSLGLQERETSLRISNEKLEASNKNYIDLIGFVAHELKGILASAVMNAYAVRDGYLGMINFKQRKAMDSVTRNLDYLDATVKKFLSLGRVERGELAVNKTVLNLKKDVFDASIGALAPMANKKSLRISNEIDPALIVQADSDLMQIVANNLVGNAIKYSPDAGQIRLTAAQIDGRVEVDVYNDSTPMTEEQMAKLFHKFSRLDNPETRKVKGTGLGLYITRQIIERHGGSIVVKPRENGNSFVFQIERN